MYVNPEAPEAKRQSDGAKGMGNTPARRLKASPRSGASMKMEDLLLVIEMNQLQEDVSFPHMLCRSFFFCFPRVCRNPSAGATSGKTDTTPSVQKTLALPSHAVDCLPEQLFELIHLTTLDLSSNKIDYVPRNVELLVNLTTLNVCSFPAFLLLCFC